MDITKNKIQLSIGLLPVLLSIAFTINDSWIVALIGIISLFLVVGLVSLFKRRESLYMFILVAIAGLPVNIKLSFWLMSEDYINSGFVIGNVLWLPLLCCIFFSVEEIAFGIITRTIWRRQYKIKI